MINIQKNYRSLLSLHTLCAAVVVFWPVSLATVHLLQHDAPVPMQSLCWSTEVTFRHYSMCVTEQTNVTCPAIHSSPALVPGKCVHGEVESRASVNKSRFKHKETR